MIIPFDRFRTPTLAVCALVASSIGSGAATIASTNFDGRTRTTTTTTNDTASNLTWATSGVANPGDLTAVPDQALANGFGQFQANGLFETAATSNAFVPNLNIHNEGSFYVDVPLAVTAPLGLMLSGLTITGIITNNAGSPQGVGREVDFRVEVLDPGNSIIASDNVNGQNAFMHNLPPIPTTSVSLDLGGVMLSSGSTYNVRLYTGADANLVGNNTGFDDLVIEGSVIPEPSAGAFALLGSLVLFIRRRRRQ